MFHRFFKAFLFPAGPVLPQGAEPLPFSGKVFADA
jgi:hypothetical protein